MDADPQDFMLNKLLELVSSIRAARPTLPEGLVEHLDDAVRSTWDNGQLLVQLDVSVFEGEDTVEWYARDHRSKQSEAGVGRESLLRLDRWIGDLCGGASS